MEVYKSPSPQPFFPWKHHPHSDDDNLYVLPPFTPGHGLTHPRGTNKSFFYLLAFFVFLCVALFTFSLIVLRPKGPNLRIDNVTVKNLAYDASSWDWPFLNATLLAGLTLKNTNFGRFEFEGNGSIVGFAYEGIVLGEKAIGRGSIGSRDTRRMRVEMVVGYSGTSPAAGNLSRGINQKVLKLRSYGRITGKIHLLKYLKRRLSSKMNCTMTLNLATRNFQDLICE